MLNEVRDTSGKFAPKSEVPRKVRSVNLTDSAWQWLAAVAEKAGMSRNDYLESLADGNSPFIETADTRLSQAETKPEPEFQLDDSVYDAIVDVDSAKKSAAIYGFTPDEALADAYFQINMLTSNYDELEDRHEALKFKYSVLLESEVGSPADEVEAVRAENQRLQIEIGNLQTEREELAQLKKQVKEDAAEVHREGNAIKVEKARWQGQLSDARAELADAKATILNQGNKIRELERGYSLKPNPKESALRLEIGELRSQLEVERADREKIEAELSDLKGKLAAALEPNERSAPIAIVELPEPADLLNQLKARRKKSKADLGDVEVILAMIEES